MKTLFASAIIAMTLAAGTIGAAAAGSPTPSPTGKAYGFHAFFKKDITLKTHRGWMVVCLNGHAQPWLRSAHDAKSQGATRSQGAGKSQGANKSQDATQGQSAAIKFSCGS